MVDHDQLIPEEREKENQSLIEDLNHYYGTQEQDSASLARIRARLLQKTATSLPVGAEEGITRLPVVSRTARNERGARPKSQKRLQRHPYLTNLAAALFLVLLVSSFALVLHLRQGMGTAPGVSSIEPGWTLVATFQGTGNKTITGQHLEVGQRFGLLLTCANSSDSWVEVEVLPEQSSDGTRCSSVPTSPSRPEGIYTSPTPFPPVQTLKVQADSSISWQLSIFKGITYPPLSIDSKEWHSIQGEVDGTGNESMQLDLTLPKIWALEYVCHGTGPIQVTMQPYAQVGSLSTTIANDPCDGQPHLDVSDTSSSGTFQAVHQLLISTGASNNWQIVLLGCANNKPHCGVTSLASGTPQATTPASPTTHLTQVYQFGEQDSGKVITYSITSRFRITLNGQKYPRQNFLVNCQPAGALGSITNLSPATPPDYTVSYEANLAGTCTIKNGSFILTVKIVS